MVNVIKCLMIAVVLTSWVFIFGFSPDPLTWENHAEQTIFPTRMMNLSEEDANIIDLNFNYFCEQLDDFEYYIPSNWDTIPERIELKKLDLFFQDYLKYDPDEQEILPFDYYFSASWSYDNPRDTRGKSVFLADYLIHRGYDAWVFVSTTDSWVEVYLNSDWRSEYEFWGTTGQWTIKFNDSIQIYSLVPYTVSIAAVFLLIFFIIISIRICLYILKKFLKEVDEFYYANKRIEWTRWKVTFAFSLILIILFSILENLHIDTLFTNDLYSTGTLAGFAIYLLEFIRVTTIALYESFVFACLVIIIYIMLNPVFLFLKEITRCIMEEISIIANLFTFNSLITRLKNTHRSDISRLLKHRLQGLIHITKRGFSKQNVSLIILAMILTLINAKPNLLWIIIQFMILFISLRLTLLCIRQINAFNSFIEIDIEGIAEFIELEILTMNSNTSSFIIAIRNLLVSLVTNLNLLIRSMLGMLIYYRNKIIAVSISWTGLFFLYWICVQIILILLGSEYANGGIFQREIESNLIVINLLLVSAYIGITSGFSLIIWNHGDNKQKSL